MNEQRLYRGKAVGNSAAKDGEWVTGGYVPDYKLFGDKEAPPTPCIYRSDIAWHVIVDPAAIGQCVGLKDKNGVLIFEGDIVKSQRGHIFVVGWEKDCRFLGRTPERSIAYVGQEPAVEVIGNIHDNPEIWKEGV